MRLLIFILALIIINACAKPHILKTKVVASEDETISFSGLQWKVRNVSGTQGPGPNYFSDKSVWVDEHGTLHFYLHKDSVTGNWLCPEITSEKKFQFGTYTFEVEGTIDRMDKNIVLGLFNYSGNDGFDEIDIEFARWGNNSYPNLNYTVWPAEKQEFRNSSYSKEYIQKNNKSTQQFIWSKDSIAFYTFNGFSTDKKNLIESHTFTQPPASISSLLMPVHINLWLFEGKPPADNKPIEILIHSFSFKK